MRKVPRGLKFFICGLLSASDSQTAQAFKAGLPVMQAAGLQDLGRSI